MQTKIRGTTDDRTQMLLGQFRKVFDPDWLQGFPSGRFTVQFAEGDAPEDELVAFADMYGYELDEKSDAAWTRYYFK